MKKPGDFYDWLERGGGQRLLHEFGEFIGESDDYFLGQCARDAGLHRVFAVTPRNIGWLLQQVESWTPPIDSTEKEMHPLARRVRWLILSRVRELVKEYPRPDRICWEEYFAYLWQCMDDGAGLSAARAYDLGFIEAAIQVAKLSARDVLHIDELETDGYIAWFDEKIDDLP